MVVRTVTGLLNEKELPCFACKRPAISEDVEK
jgi:hypothetical protein